jgi:hypothetical protein
MKHSNSIYSLEGEFSAERKKRRKPGKWKWVILIVLGWLFVYRSTRPVMSLSAQPPPSFYDYNRSWSPQEAQHARELAREYWRVAVRRIQREYSPNRPLPQNPPVQFRIGDTASDLESDAMTARARYWYRLREVWSEPKVWVVSYGWSTAWVGNTLDSFSRYIPNWFSGLVQVLVELTHRIAQMISPP